MADDDLSPFQAVESSNEDQYQRLVRNADSLPPWLRYPLGAGAYAHHALSSALVSPFASAERLMQHPPDPSTNASIERSIPHATTIGLSGLGTGGASAAIDGAAADGLSSFFASRQQAKRLERAKLLHPDDWGGSNAYNEAVDRFLGGDDPLNVHRDTGWANYSMPNGMQAMQTERPGQFVEKPGALDAPANSPFSDLYEHTGDAFVAEPKLAKMQSNSVQTFGEPHGGFGWPPAELNASASSPEVRGMLMDHEGVHALSQFSNGGMAGSLANFSSPMTPHLQALLDAEAINYGRLSPSDKYWFENAIKRGQKTADYVNSPWERQARAGELGGDLGLIMTDPASARNVWDMRTSRSRPQTVHTPQDLEMYERFKIPYSKEEGDFRHYLPFGWKVSE